MHKCYTRSNPLIQTPTHLASHTLNFNVSFFVMSDSAYIASTLYDVAWEEDNLEMDLITIPQDIDVQHVSVLRIY